MPFNFFTYIIHIYTCGYQHQHITRARACTCGKKWLRLPNYIIALRIFCILYNISYQNYHNFFFYLHVGCRLNILSSDDNPQLPKEYVRVLTSNRRACLSVPGTMSPSPSWVCARAYHPMFKSIKILEK